MKQNALNKTLISLGVAAALPFAANAAPPVAYDSTFTQSNGQVTGYTCGAGLTCDSNPITDDGFYQTSATDLAGNQYIHQVILGGSDQGPDEYFKTETWVLIGSTDGGLALDQIVDEVNGGSTGSLESTTQINRGFFLDPLTENRVDLTQSITDTTVAGNPAAGTFVADFVFSDTPADLDAANGGAGGDATNDRIALVDLSQSIDPGDNSFTDSFVFAAATEETFDENNAATGSTITNTKVDLETLVNLGTGLTDQTFTYDYASGDIVTAGSATLSNGVVVDWVDGDTIDSVTLGQGVANAGDFYYQSFADKVDTGSGNPADDVEFASEFSLSSPPAPIVFLPAIDPFL